jgi:hypothetical protein
MHWRITGMALAAELYRYVLLPVGEALALTRKHLLKSFAAVNKGNQIFRISGARA